jgi:lysosomal acid lipase/cholesteryl ester hydrolase
MKSVLLLCLICAHFVLADVLDAFPLRYGHV